MALPSWMGRTLSLAHRLGRPLGCSVGLSVGDSPGAGVHAQRATPARLLLGLARGTLRDPAGMVRGLLEVGAERRSGLPVVPSPRDRFFIEALGPRTTGRGSGSETGACLRARAGPGCRESVPAPVARLLQRRSGTRRSDALMGPDRGALKRAGAKTVCCIWRTIRLPFANVARTCGPIRPFEA